MLQTGDVDAEDASSRAGFEGVMKRSQITRQCNKHGLPRLPDGSTIACIVPTTCHCGRARDKQPAAGCADRGVSSIGAYNRGLPCTGVQFSHPCAAAYQQCSVRLRLAARLDAACAAVPCMPSRHAANHHSVARVRGSCKFARADSPRACVPYSRHNTNTAGLQSRRPAVIHSWEA